MNGDNGAMRWASIRRAPGSEPASNPQRRIFGRFRDDPWSAFYGRFCDDPALLAAAALVVIGGLWSAFGQFSSAGSDASAGSRLVAVCGSSASGRQVPAPATLADGVCETGSK